MTYGCSDVLIDVIVVVISAVPVVIADPYLYASGLIHAGVLSLASSTSTLTSV